MLECDQCVYQISLKVGNCACAQEYRVGTLHRPLQGGEIVRETIEP